MSLSSKRATEECKQNLANSVVNKDTDQAEASLEKPKEDIHHADSCKESGAKENTDEKLKSEERPKIDESNTSNSAEKSNKSEDSETECVICFEEMQLETTLPCKHKFCFNCAKSMVYTGGKCGLCRKKIPRDFLRRPHRYVNMDAVAESRKPGDGHCWFYASNTEGQWWQYDDLASKKIEQAFQNKPKSSVHIIFAGKTFNIDLDSMTQAMNNEDDATVRKVKRDLRGSDRIGICGIPDNPRSIDSSDDDISSSDDDSLDEYDSEAYDSTDGFDEEMDGFDLHDLMFADRHYHNLLDFVDEVGDYYQDSDDSDISIEHNFDIEGNF